MAEVSTLPEMEIDVDGFPIIGSDNIVTPVEAAIFKRGEPDVMSFANDIKPKETTTTEPIIPAGDAQKRLLDELTAATGTDTPEESVENDKPKPTGSAKVDKSAMVEYLKSKIESKEFVTFDDYDEKTPIDEYLSKLPNKDLNSLIDENLKLREENVKREVPQQFYEGLSEELRLAYEYEANGGTDTKGFFRALGEVRQIKALDPEKEDDQEEIVYEYYRNANPDWTTDEIKEEVETIKNNALLAKKASQLKPKLDQMKDRIIQYRLEEQAEAARQRQEAAQMYVKNVYDTLKPSELSGIKLDAKTQSSLYNGLTRAEYRSVTGNPTNELGYLLEKYQYSDEKNYAKIAKVLWLLKDEEGYENALIQKGKNINTEETVKKLKLEQGNRASSTAFDEGGDASRVRTSTSRIQRNANPFKR